MIYNKEITGYENEEEFANYLNGKQVGRVYPNFLYIRKLRFLTNKIE